MAILSKIYNFNRLFKNTINFGLKLRNFAICESKSYIKSTNINNQSRNKSYLNIFRKPNMNQLKVIDDMPTQIDLIYNNTMSRYLLFAQVASSICGVIIFLAVIIKGDRYNPKLNIEQFVKKPKQVENETLVYVSAFAILVVLLQFMVSRMPLRVYHYPKSDKYTFIFYGVLPFAKKRIIANSSQIIKLPEEGILPWKESRFQILDERNIILIENFFRNNADLNIMLGYQKETDD